jgi:hypothetical protein
MRLISWTLRSGSEHAMLGCGLRNMLRLKPEKTR